MFPAVLFAALLLLLLLGGAYLLYKEFTRFLADREPGPRPTPEEAALDRWNARVVMLVAGLSVMGAVLAWWASATFADAQTLSDQAVQQSIQYQTTKSVEDSKIEFSARVAEQYQEHTAAESNLYKEAAAAWNAGNQDEALELEAEGRVEAAQARVLAGGYLGYYGGNPDSNGKVSFSIADQEANALANNSVLLTEDPTHIAAMESDAAAQRQHAEEYVLAGVLAFVAVFFLTISYLSRRHRRVFSLAPGVMAIAASVVAVLLAGLS